MANITINIPPNFMANVNQFMANVRRMQVLTTQFVQASQRVQPPPATQMSGVMSHFQRMHQILLRASATFQRFIDTIINAMGSMGRSFIRIMTPIYTAATAFVGFAVTAATYTFKIATGAISGASWLMKWIFDKMVGLGDSILADFLAASGSYATVAGLKSYRAAFGGIPDDPGMHARIAQARGSQVSKEYIALQLLGVRNLTDTADMMTEATLAAARFMKKQTSGLELLMADAFNLYSLFSPDRLLALKYIDMEELEQAKKLYDQYKPLMQITEKAQIAWVNFALEIRAMWVKIQTAIAEGLADAGFIRAMNMVSQSITRFVQLFLNSPVTERIVRNLGKWIDDLGDWLSKPETFEKFEKVLQDIGSIIKTVTLGIHHLMRLYDLFHKIPEEAPLNIFPGRARFLRRLGMLEPAGRLQYEPVEQGRVGRGDYRGGRAYPPDQPVRAQTVGNLKSLRAPLIKELEGNPKLQRDLNDLTEAEIGDQGSAARTAFVESVFNRAISRHQTLDYVIHNRGKPYYPWTTMRHVGSGYGRDTSAIVKGVGDGSNLSDYATGNASHGVGFDHGPKTYDPHTGEYFGVEGSDLPWVRLQKRYEGEKGVITIQPPTRPGAPSTGAAPTVIGPAGDVKFAEKASGADRRLVNLVRETSKYLPEGWRAEIRSEFRPGDPRFHGQGRAVDVQLIAPGDKGGKDIPWYQRPDAYSIYQSFALKMRENQKKMYPELNDHFRWGGYFAGGQGAGPGRSLVGAPYGAMDLMHFDTGPTSLMAAGSWEGGLSAEWARRWGISYTGYPKDTIMGSVKVPDSPADGWQQYDKVPSWTGSKTDPFDPSYVAEKGFGALSAEFETEGGGRGGGWEEGGKDNIGWAWGRWQFNSRRELPAFVDKWNKNHPNNPLPEGADAAEAGPGSPFYTKWHELATTKEFHEAQRTFAFGYEHGVETKARSLGFDTTNRGVREAINSMIQQHGVGSEDRGTIMLLKEAAGTNPKTVDDQINAIYNARQALSDRHPEWGIGRRYDKERIRALQFSRLGDTRSKEAKQAAEEDKAVDVHEPVKKATDDKEDKHPTHTVKIDNRSDHDVVPAEDHSKSEASTEMHGSPL